MANKKVTHQDTQERVQILISPEAAQRLRIASALSEFSQGRIITRLILNSLPPASKALAETDHLSNA